MSTKEKAKTESVRVGRANSEATAAWAGLSGPCRSFDDPKARGRGQDRLDRNLARKRGQSEDLEVPGVLDARTEVFRDEGGLEKAQ